MDYLKIINDKNMYMLSDPLKTDKMNNIRLKKIIKQFKLKTELSETNNVQYNKRTESIVNQLMNELKTLYKNIKEIKNGSKS